MFQRENHKLRSAVEVLSTCEVRSWQERVRAHQSLLGKIRDALPPELAGHCLDCAVNDGRLLVFTDGQAWSFQLRFHAPALLAHLRSSGGYSLRSVQARGLSDFFAKPERAKPMLKSTMQAAAVVQMSAEGNPSTELGDALRRLARTLRQRAQA